MRHFNRAICLLMTTCLLLVSSPALAHKHKHKHKNLKKHIAAVKPVRHPHRHHAYRVTRKLYCLPALKPTNYNDTVTNFNHDFINLMRHWRVQGATIAVIKNNKLVLSSGFGWSDVNRRIAMKPDNLFRIASISKAITAVSTLKLLQDRGMSVDTKVFDILKDVAPLPNHTVNPQIYKITLRNLMQMSSGWYTMESGYFDPLFGPWPRSVAAQFPNQATPPDCITATRYMMSRRMQFQPGASYSYSNLNYCMLGLVINKLNGTTGAEGYQRYVYQHILSPLNIHDMRIGSTVPQFRAPNEVTYYIDPAITHVSDLARVTSGLPYGGSELLRKNYSDGGWIASAIDLANFGNGVTKLLNNNSLALMTAPPTYGASGGRYFGMGWSIEHINGHRYWVKHGSFTGTTGILIRRDDGAVFAALFNSEPIDKVRFLNQVKMTLINHMRYI